VLVLVMMTAEVNAAAAAASVAARRSCWDGYTQGCGYDQSTDVDIDTLRSRQCRGAHPRTAFHIC